MRLDRISEKLVIVLDFLTNTLKRFKAASTLNYLLEVTTFTDEPE